MATPTTRSEQLLGAIVRSRVDELGLSWTDLEAMTGIPERTLHNTTRDVTPDRMRRYRVAKLARAIKLPLAKIVATNEGVPDEPPKQPAKPAGPPRRQDTEDKRTGPKRASDSGRAA